MNNRIIINKLDKIQNLDNLIQNIPLNSFENSSEDDFNILKIDGENMNENLDTDWKLSSKENKIIKYRNSFNNFKIEKTSFFIEGIKILDNKKIINSDLNKKSGHDNKELNKRGRKRKRNDTNENPKKKTHDKFYDDNLTKKCKNIILKYALKFINKKIEEIYKDDIGYGKFKKELKIINQTNKVKSTVNVDKSFLDKNLKDIFSENISSRFYNFPETYNKTLIESLVNEKDEEKKIFFTELFNITFLDCLQYFMDDNDNNEKLNGFIKFSTIKESILKKHEKRYIDAFIYFLRNFKEIINNKRSRKKINEN
jgi:hypothetical protein